MTIRRPVTIEPNALGNYDYYCRQCGAYHNQKEWPVFCKICGNTEVIEGFGVSGDNGVSNTTVTNAWNVNSFLAAGTIDKQRR